MALKLMWGIFLNIWIKICMNQKNISTLKYDQIQIESMLEIQENISDVKIFSYFSSKLRKSSGLMKLSKVG